MNHYSCAPAPAAPGGSGGTDPADQDWLTMPEAALDAMHAQALAQYLQSRSGGRSTRAAASLALLHQLVVARSIVRAGRQDAATARAAMRSDRALGYLFGLASDGLDPAREPRDERRIASTLMLLHDLAYGRRAAEALTENLVAGGSKAMGQGFADGIMAAAEDLAALGRWRRGAGGGLPGGLLDEMHWPGWLRDGSGELPH